MALYCKINVALRELISQKFGSESVRSLHPDDHQGQVTVHYWL